MVEALLAVTRLDGGVFRIQPAPIDMGQVVVSVVGRIRGSQSKRAISVDLPTVPVWAHADRIRIEQVLGNLIDNALKYSDGDVHVRLSAEPVWLRVSVSDHGAGIPLDQQDGLFTRFYRVGTDATAQHNGLGLSLYIGREIIKLHGGQIGFETQLNRGSTFYFTLLREPPDGGNSPP
jgi:signal transduction histidine kinase